jgi:nucleotide-binding universal stress UspA family protein
MTTTTFAADPTESGGAESHLTVLIATDGSDAAVAAAHSAIGLLRPGARVVLAVVIPEMADPEADAGGFEGPLMTEEEAEHEWESANDTGEEALGRTTSQMSGEVEERVIPSDASPGSAIVHCAEEIDADLVVVGASGKGLFKRLFSGSVSDHVVHHAPCPVLVIRSDHAPR